MVIARGTLGMRPGRLDSQLVISAAAMPIPGWGSSTHPVATTRTSRQMQRHGPSFSSNARPNSPISSSKTFHPSGTVNVSGVSKTKDVYVPGSSGSCGVKPATSLGDGVAATV